ncbi:unnamed protein product [Moneuplotes crassus]|uniref:Uncharacterized protein n=2 Tax=Euplotes crassus TaxID=5936 RepID=A0AAD2D5Y4_EUPCR|nr:unnamed protein product [Moneuplotes crassus]
MTLFQTSNYAYVKRLIGEDDDTKNLDDMKSSFAMKLSKYLRETGTEDIIEIISATNSGIIPMLYAVETYFDLENIPPILKIIEIIILSYFILQFLLFFYTAESRVAYCFGIYAILDYITIIPFFLVRVGVLGEENYLLFWRVLRLFCIFRINKLFKKKNKEISRRTFTLIFTLVSTMFFMAAAMLEVENNFLDHEIPKIEEKVAQDIPLEGFESNYPEKNYTFHEMIYFMIVTMTTVGYGDIFPFTDAGRLLIILTIGVMLGLLPTQFQELLKVQSLTSKYARFSYKKSKKDSRHILVLGNAPPDDIRTFLDECYHPDHGQADINVIIMRNSSPTKEMVDILKPHSGRAIYLEGNPLNHKDLKRAMADSATCVVVLSNKFCKDPIMEDYSNILQSFCVKQYAKARKDKELRLCLQLVKPEHKDLYYSGLQSEIRIDQVICVEELKLQLLAKSCISPGIITIIWSLITSNTPSINLKDKKEENNKKSIANPDPRSQENEWMKNYLSGTDFELYRVPLKQKLYAGYKFKDVVMILFHQLNLILIALEVKIGDQLKVFVNPSEYVFEPLDHHGYVIHHENPDYNMINNLNLDKNNSENFFISRYLNKKELNSQKKSKFLCNMNLSKIIGPNLTKTSKLNYENFACTKKPVPLIEAQIKKCIDKGIEDHIIVCGIISGIQNLILPLRSKTLSNPRIPIVILSNDNGREDGIDCETNIWREINCFEEIYIMQGSALNPADLEKARITKAIAVIILAKPHEGGGTANIKYQTMMDADVIFMYKTIRSTYNASRIITDLASTSTINFLIQGKDENLEKYGYSISKPFAAGEIYFSSLLDTLLCQAYYSPKITEILNQMIMGSANTPEKLSKVYKQFNLSQCSLTSVDVPDIKNLSFSNLFEYFVKVHNTIPIGVYKSYVWLHPKESNDYKITPNDKLFVLTDKAPHENMGIKNVQQPEQQHAQGGKFAPKNEEKKLEKENLLTLQSLNKQLQDLFISTKEVFQDVKNTNKFIIEDLADKVKSDI